jgi:23S rRNA (guanosine2251-2'-O)-methyltransferase
MTDIIFGRNPVTEALDSGVEIEKIYMLNSMRGETEVMMRRICKEKNIPLAKVPEIKLKELTKNKVHQGLVAMISPIRYQEVQDIIAGVFENGQTPLLLVADGVTDVRNLGALARSAYFFGAHALILSGGVGGRINDEAVKASAGAMLKIPVCRNPSIFNLISELQSAGIKVLASGMKTENSISESYLNEPVAILLGSEDKGLHPKVFEVVDEVVKIPAGGDFDSLNVSVAGGILMYEVNRQRHSKN